MQMTVWIYVISPNNIRRNEMSLVFLSLAKTQAHLSEIMLDKWF